MGLRTTIFGKVYAQPIDQTQNLFIGNVADIFPTKESLASTLITSTGGTFLADDIINFTVSANNIKCRVVIPYKISYAFSIALISPSLTYYIDKENLIDIHSNMFAGHIFLKKVEMLNNNLFIGAAAFWKNTFLKYVNLPNCVNYGDNTRDNTIFYGGLRVGESKIFAHPTMQTINGGAIEPDLLYVRDTRGATLVFRSNSTPPNSITNLAVNTVYKNDLIVDWTAPVSTNGIDHYEVYLDDDFLDFTNDLVYLFYDLVYLQSYKITVRAIDTQGNESVSNSIIQSINGINEFYRKSAIVASWKFQEDSLPLIDDANGHDLTGTYQSLKQPSYLLNIPKKSFSVYMFNKRLSAVNHSNFSFTDGINDKPFSIELSIRFFNNTQNSWVLSKRSETLNKEYELIYSSKKIIFKCFDQSSGGSINIEFPIEVVPFQWYRLGVTYSGSGLHTGLKLFIDTIKVGTTSLTGTYNKMQVGTENLVIGGPSWSTGYGFLGYLNDSFMANTEFTETEMVRMQNKNINGYEIY